MHDPQRNVHDVHDPQYHLIAALWQFLNIQQLRSLYLAVSSERTHCFAKQMAECRFRPPKTSEEEEKCVASPIPR